MSAPECLRCGVCCFSDSPTYVRVTGDDWSRLGAAAEQYALFVANRAFMRMRDGHCAALEMRSRADGATEFVCGIYAARPQACRDLGRGTPPCDGERDTKSARVVAAVARSQAILVEQRQAPRADERL